MPPVLFNTLNEAIQAFSICNVCRTMFGYTIVDYPTYEDLPLTLDVNGKQIDLEDCPIAGCDGSLTLS